MIGRLVFLTIVFGHPLLLVRGSDDFQEPAKESLEGQVLTLTDDNFEEALNNHPIMFVDFYAPWCGVCKKFRPRWKEIAKTYAKKNSKIKFASINAEDNRKTAFRYEITAYPTLLLFFNGDRYYYEQAHEENLLEEFIDRITENPTPYSEDIIKTIYTTDKIALYVAEDPDPEITKLFQQTSRIIRFLPFYLATPSEGLAEALHNKKSQIFLTKRKGAEVIPYHGEMNIEDLVGFFSAYR